MKFNGFKPWSYFVISAFSAIFALILFYNERYSLPMLLMSFNSGMTFGFGIAQIEREKLAKEIASMNFNVKALYDFKNGNAKAD